MNIDEMIFRIGPRFKTLERIDRKWKAVAYRYGPGADITALVTFFDDTAAGVLKKLFDELYENKI